MPRRSTGYEVIERFCREACSSSVLPRLIFDNLLVGRAILPAADFSAGGTRWKAGPQPKRPPHIGNLNCQ
jgi:hypothetical protein